MEKKAYFENGWEDIKVYNLAKMLPGHQVKGPAIIVQDISTIVVELDCEAIMNNEGDLEIIVGGLEDPDKAEDETEEGAATKQVKEDPVMLSIFGHRFMGIGENGQGAKRCIAL